MQFVVKFAIYRLCCLNWLYNLALLQTVMPVVKFAICICLPTKFDPHCLELARNKQLSNTEKNIVQQFQILMGQSSTIWSYDTSTLVLYVRSEGRVFWGWYFLRTAQPLRLCTNLLGSFETY